MANSLEDAHVALTTLAADIETLLTEYTNFKIDQRKLDNLFSDISVIQAKVLAAQQKPV